MAFWQAAPGDGSVAVKVQPKSRRPGLQGGLADGSRLRIGVSEPAEALRQPYSAVSVTAGVTYREKILLVIGNATAIAAKLAAIETRQ